MTITNKDLDELLKNESYKEIVSIIKKEENPTLEQQHYLGIAYYKLENFNHAKITFEYIYKKDQNNEIIAYLIICYIKCNEMDTALNLYQTLCEVENKQIINYIQQNDFENALNICLFLKSIPINLPIKDTSSNDIIALVNSFDYSNLSLKLLEKLN